MIICTLKSKKRTMKKILLALTVLTLPFTSNAQAPTKQLSEATIQAAIDRFVPAYCKDGIKGLITPVYDCEADTPKDSPESEVCLIGDMTLIVNVIQLRKKSHQLGEKDIFADVPFVQKDHVNKRLNQYISLPHFQFLKTTDDYMNYFRPGRIKLENAMTSHCP